MQENDQSSSQRKTFLMNNLRILSLLPAATEIVYLLGLEKYLVGVSDDCDSPPQVKKIPRVTECLIDQNLTSKEIDKKVKTLQHQGVNVSHLDENLLRDLKPNLILTQDICPVCAVSYTQVQKVARILDSNVKIISLEPESIEDILDNILLLGEVSGKNFKAKEVVESLKKRMEDCKLKIKNLLKPKVLVVEWLDPIMVAGHWTPQMVQLAGGINLLTILGEVSKKIAKSSIKSSDPDILIISPCGFDIQRTLKERKLIYQITNSLPKKIKKYLVDGNSYMTRPGPRIIDGIEILAEIIHPQIFPRGYTKKDWIELK